MVSAGKGAITKAAGKGVGKSLLKKIPGVGLIAGLGFAASRLMKGDALGAFGEVASGVASLVPGIGTAVSATIDAGLMAKDISKASEKVVEKEGGVEGAQSRVDAKNKEIEENKKSHSELVEKLNELISATKSVGKDVAAQVE